MTDPETNLAIAHRITAAFEQGDDATMRELYATDHLLHPHWHDPLPLPGDDDQPVLDRYEQSDAHARTDMTDLHVTVEEQIPCGDWLGVLQQLGAVGPSRELYAQADLTM